MECDDGNNKDGDGCSASCKIEQEYTCRGGSPSTADNCIFYNPTDLTYTMTGQIRYASKMVINVKLDYLPKKLLQSTDCNDRCSQILSVNVVQGDRPTSVRSFYISGSRYSFSVEMEFGKPYISKLKVEIKVNERLAGYFGKTSIRNSLTVDLNPAQLTLATKDSEFL